MFHLLTCSVSSNKPKQKSKGVGSFFCAKQTLNLSIFLYLSHAAFFVLHCVFCVCARAISYCQMREREKCFAFYLNGDASIVKHRFI